MGNEQSSGAGADDLRLHNVPIKLPTGESKLTCQFSIFPFQSGPNFTLVSISFQHFMSRFWVLGSISRWYHTSSELFLPLKFKMWTKIWVGPLAFWVTLFYVSCWCDICRYTTFQTATYPTKKSSKPDFKTYSPRPMWVQRVPVSCIITQVRELELSSETDKKYQTNKNGNWYVIMTVRQSKPLLLSLSRDSR